MEKLKQLTEKMFNVKNIKKCLQIGVLGTALMFAAMGFAGCQHDSEEEPKEEPEVEYCNEDGCEKKGEALPHSHDYCEVDGCTDKHTDTNGIHYAEWVDFKDFGNGFKVPYVRFNNESEEEVGYTNDKPQGINGIDLLNDYQKEFKKYIESLTFSDNFTFDHNINYYTFSDGTVAGSIINANENFDYLIKNINDVCVPVFEEIAQQVEISGDNDLAKKRFYWYYRTLSNEVYKYSHNNFEIHCPEEYGKTTYDAEKNNIINSSIINDAINDIGADIQNGCLQVAEQMGLMLSQAANKMGVAPTDLQNIVNLSLVMSSLSAVHEYTSVIPDISHSIEAHCPTNTMADVIKNFGPVGRVQNNDKGIELC